MASCRKNVSAVLAAGVAGWIFMAAAPARAQDADVPEGGAPSQTAPAAGGDEIVVTGSRITATGFTAPTPTTVLGEADIQRVSAANIADLLVQVPAFRGTGIPGTNVETSAVYANLRAIGPERTLVLVNGRRHVATFSDGTMDLGVIPTGLIERAEIVTGGASASWGSDAVAGVINLILKDDLQGIEVSAQAGISDYGDAENQRLYVAGGGRFADDRGHVLLAAEYSNDAGVGSLNEPFNSRPYGGRNVVGNPAFATNGLPGTIYDRDVRNASYTEGGLITSGPLRGTQFVGAGDTTQFGYGQLFGQFMIGGASNFNHRHNAEDAKQPLERFNVYGRASFDLSESLNLFVEGNFASAISRGFKGIGSLQQGAATAPAACPRTTVQSRFGGFFVPVTNPYLPQAVRNQLLAAGETCFAFGKSIVGPGGLGQVLSDDGVPELYRGVAGIEAELGGGWDMSAYAQHGVSDYRYRRNGNVIFANLEKAVDAVQVGSQIVCRVNADAITTNDDPACAPLNLFGENTASVEAMNYISAGSRLDIRTKQTVAAVSFSGPLFALWSDDVYAAVGAEYREESALGVADPISTAAGFRTGNRSGIAGQYNVKEVYGELAIPIVQDMAAFQNLSAQLAARYTDYSGSGGVVTWKAGMTWDVTSDVRLRATRSRDIRAGNIGELFAPAAVGLTNVFDRRTNVSVGVVTRTSGNTAIRPEKADTLTAGVVFSPEWIPGFRASIDYYDISISEIIAALTAQQVVDRCYVEDEASYCDRITLVGGALSEVRTSFDNLNQLDTRGIEFELEYTVPASDLFNDMSGGRLSVTALATYVDLLRLKLASSGSAISPLGQYDNPKWTGFATLGYANDKLRFDLEEQFFAGGKIDNTKVEGEASLNGININRVPATWYTNLYASYAPAGLGERGLEFFARVNNLFNQSPPFPSPVVPAVNTISNQSRNFSAVGRSYLAGIRIKI